MKKVVVAGGTGFVGSHLVRRLTAERYTTVVLTRGRSRKSARESLVSYVHWDAKAKGTWVPACEGASAIINLTGESIGARRWSNSQKERIIRSRIDSTAAIVGAVNEMGAKPAVLVNMSAVGYYGDTGDEEVTEDHSQGEGFLAGTVASWEEEAQKIRSSGVRLVLPRTGVVLGRGAEALNRIVLPFRLFVGGPIGSGAQWFPWIHIDDVTNAILFLLAHERLSGPVNLTAPGQVRMGEFCTILGEVMHRPSWFPVPSLPLKILLGEMAQIILTGQRVLAGRLEEAGFEFSHPDLRGALRQTLLTDDN